MGVWPGLTENFGAGTNAIPFEDMVERTLFAESPSRPSSASRRACCAVEEALVSLLAQPGPASCST